MKAWVCRLHHFLEKTIFNFSESNTCTDPKLSHEIPCNGWINHKTLCINNGATHWKYGTAVNIRWELLAPGQDMSLKM
jgi:hypothetical protein